MGVGVVGRALAAQQPQLAEVEAVVGGEDDVGVRRRPCRRIRSTSRSTDCAIRARSRRLVCACDLVSSSGSAFHCGAGGRRHARAVVATRSPNPGRSRDRQVAAVDEAAVAAPVGAARLVAEGGGEQRLAGVRRVGRRRGRGARTARPRGSTAAGRRGARAGTSSPGRRSPCRRTRGPCSSRGAPAGGAGQLRTTVVPLSVGAGALEVPPVVGRAEDRAEVRPAGRHGRQLLAARTAPRSR